MDAPTIRKTYDAIEKRLAPRLEAFVRTSHYAHLSAILVEARAAVASTVDGVAARVLHAVNLPAGTDVKRLRRQIGELDREVRQLRLDVAADPERRGEVSRDVDAVRAPRRGRPDSR